MAKIRVIRIIEHTYDSVEEYEHKSSMWALSGTGSRRFSATETVCWATLPLQTLPDDVPDEIAGVI